MNISASYFILQLVTVSESSCIMLFFTRVNPKEPHQGSYITLVLISVDCIILWVVLLQPKLVKQVVHFFTFKFSTPICISGIKECVCCFLRYLKGSHHSFQSSKLTVPSPSASNTS